MTKKKPYFHNNVEALIKAPAEFFESIEFDEFMDWHWSHLYSTKRVRYGLPSMSVPVSV